MQAFLNDSVSHIMHGTIDSKARMDVKHIHLQQHSTHLNGYKQKRTKGSHKWEKYECKHV